MHSLNSIVRIDNSQKENYGRVGEIVGYAELLNSKDLFYYAIKFDNDPLTYIYDHDDLYLTGQRGNRQLLVDNYLNLDGKDETFFIFRIRDSIDTAVYKPSYYRSRNIFIFKLPREYAIEHVMPVMNEVIASSNDFNRAEFLVIDYSDTTEVGYLGIGDEILELCRGFKDQGGIEYFFVGIGPKLKPILELMLDDMNQRTFDTLAAVQAHIGS